MKPMIKIVKVILILITGIYFSCNNKTQKTTNGIIGIYCSEPDLTSIKGVSVLTSLNQKWDDSVDYEGDTSGEWDGYIISPVSGDVSFYLSTNRTIQLKISNKDSLQNSNESPEKILTVKMKKGQSYPIHIVFYNPGEHEDIGWFNVDWSWDKNKKSTIPSSNLYYTDKETQKFSFLNHVEDKNNVTDDLIYAKVENIIVYYEPGRFAGWPANGGIWNWGNEILVSFTRGYFKENKYHHAIDRNKPAVPVFSRSKDGGLTWILEDTISLGMQNDIKINTEKIDFTSPGFALQNTNDLFQYSYDRGKSWKGPFQYPDFGKGELTSRTDYLVKNKGESLIFTSAKVAKVQAALQDRAMVIKTSDAGLNFEFVSWMTEQDTIRSVMPATVRMDQNHLVSALRRRLDPPKGERYGLPRNWIDVYESFDNGKTWKFLNKIADTDTGIRNGNPPSMVRLINGTLCVIYGYRGLPYGIRARVSRDNGKTWSKEIILRDDSISWDLGYLRSVVREDGKVVSIYYYATKERPERHIEATIWNPMEIIKE